MIGRKILINYNQNNSGKLRTRSVVREKTEYVLLQPAIPHNLICFTMSSMLDYYFLIPKTNYSLFQRVHSLCDQ